jgi:hypothetical protein
MIATRPDRGRLLVGAILVIVGGVALAAQLIGFRLGESTWPLLVLAPGLGLLVIGYLVRGPLGVGLCILGGMTTMTGAVLLYQELSGNWATWAYAWALVAPGGVGLGLALAGISQGDRELTDNGWRVALVGAGLFIGFGLFFEGLLGLSTGRSMFEEPVMPVLLVVAGAGIIGYGLFAGRRREA